MAGSEGRYSQVRSALEGAPKTWLVTGAAGFIGSHLVEALLGLDQRVVGMDNFATGHRRNLDDVRSRVKPAQWERFVLAEGDIRNPSDCARAFSACGDTKVQHVLHEAALGSVPRSIDDPVTTNAVNVDGFLNMLVAARDAGVGSFIYAASSSTYGDHPALPKVEEHIGRPLSPYAVTKYVNELYADVFARSYGFNTIGLRYFNVFGRRQDPQGPYAAVIPRWIAALLRQEPVFINGDGETSRDFCPVANVVQANLLAATAPADALNQVYNVALGGRTSLNQLFDVLRSALGGHGVDPATRPVHRGFRDGDVRHSLADVGKARRLLGYEPQVDVAQGIAATIPWYTG